MMPTGIGPDGTDAARLSALEALIEAGAEVDARTAPGHFLDAEPTTHPRDSSIAVPCCAAEVNVAEDTGVDLLL